MRVCGCSAPSRSVESSKVTVTSEVTVTCRQKRQAEHIEEQYKEDGVPEDEAERRAWATVNKTSGGAKKSGSGRGKAENKEPARRGGRKGGEAS